jgi:hypothetical protein
MPDDPMRSRRRERTPDDPHYSRVRDDLGRGVCARERCWNESGKHLVQGDGERDRQQQPARRGIAKENAEPFARKRLGA